MTIQTGALVAFSGTWRVVEDVDCYEYHGVIVPSAERYPAGHHVILPQGATPADVADVDVVETVRGVEHANDDGTLERRWVDLWRIEIEEDT